jgi:Rrf2 family iron-sulfur cluster assembly transcriptional regulator
MLSFSKKLLYAIEAVADIAYNTGGEPVQSGDITQRQGIPRRYLEPVLQQLVRAGILAGVRGPKGGYRLARERRRITLGDITRVVCAVDDEEGPDVTTKSEIGVKVIQPMWDGLQRDCMARLDEITIEELCRQARGVGVESEAFRRLDYTI